jgi:hypothetical protein
MVGKIFQSRSWIFKIAVILIVFWSAFIGFFNIAVFYWFGIPILGLLLGIILVWFSKTRIREKLFLTFIPIPVILIAFFIFYLLLPKAEPETFLIPHNFRGYIVVVFNENCGRTVPYENGRRIYDFSKNNIVITMSKATLGVIDREFYLIDESGNRTQLPEFHWSKFEDEQKDWHWTFSKMKLSKDLVGVDTQSGNINYLIFTVNDYQSLEKESKEIKEEKQKSFRNKLESSLKKCRQYSLQ